MTSRSVEPAAPPTSTGSGNQLQRLGARLAAVERRHIARVLRLVEGNKSRAARILGVDRRTLQRKGY